jgi:hypothetical protein
VLLLNYSTSYAPIESCKANFSLCVLITLVFYSKLSIYQCSLERLVAQNVPPTGFYHLFSGLSKLQFLLGMYAIICSANWFLAKKQRASGKTPTLSL